MANLSDLLGPSGVQLSLDEVGQAEAEAGTNTTARLWTSQRVKQAITANSTPTGVATLIKLGMSI